MAAHKTINVLYAISSLANEGPTRVLLNTIRNLDTRQFMPSIVTFTREKENSLWSEFKKLDVAIVQLADETKKGKAGALRRVLALRELLQRGDFHIAHAHCPRSLFFLLAANSSRVRTAYTIHGYPDVQFKVIHGPIKGRLITAASNWALHRLNQPIACSDSVAAEYYDKRGLNIPAINNGIAPLDLSGFEDRGISLQHVGLSSGRRYLLFVGRLSAEKRIAELARTFAQIAEPPLDLVVVGAGPEDERLSAMKAPHIHLMGFQRDIRPFLAGCDYHVSPSATEGLANSLLEAMSVGMPSLLSDIPSHRSVMQRCHGFIGKTFDPSSVQSLLSGIEYLQSKDSTNVREGIRRDFTNLFHAEVMSRGHEEMYRLMLA